MKNTFLTASAALAFLSLSLPVFSMEAETEKGHDSSLKRAASQQILCLLENQEDEKLDAKWLEAVHHHFKLSYSAKEQPNMLWDQINNPDECPQEMKEFILSNTYTPARNWSSPISYECLGLNFRFVYFLSDINLENCSLDWKLEENSSFLLPLCKSPHLQKLSLRMNRLEKHMDALIPFEACGNLTDLDLSSNQIGPGLTALRNLTTLEKLNLRGNNIRNEDVVPVTNLTRLTFLNLSLNRGYLTALPSLKKLETLNMGGGTIYPPAFLPLVRSLPNLTALDIPGSRLGTIGPHFAVVKFLTNLTKLNVGDNLLIGAGFACLTNLRKLKELNVAGNSLPPVIMAKLHELLPQLTFQSENDIYTETFR